MYLESIDLNFIQPCTTDSLRIRIKANLPRDISDIFPYLNTYLKFAIYNEKANIITFNKEHKIITIYPNTVNIAKILNETEAFEILDYLKDIINIVDQNRDTIKPSYEIKKLPSPLEIYKYLPKLNCKKCSQETCLSFASKLIKDETKIRRCIPLYDNSNKENLENLENILLMIGYSI
ncbi:MAG: (Fe-S)-binding protein [Romboutsia sp.]